MARLLIGGDAHVRRRIILAQNLSLTDVLTPMSTPTLTDIVRAHEGVLVDYQQDGLLLLDRSGQYLKYLPPDAEASQREDALQFLSEVTVRTRLQKGQNNGSPQSGEFLGITVNLTLDSISDERECEGTALLVRGLAEKQRVHVVVYFREPPVKWETALEEFFAGLNDLLACERVDLLIVGPFVKMEESSKQSLMDHNVRLLFMHSPIAGGARESEAAREVIYDIADFGFRVPVAWQIHAENVRTVRATIDEEMYANYTSGFALPLILYSPFYECIQDTYRLPQTQDYLELLADVYKSYPFYDDVLFPLSALATGAYRGGVCNTQQTAKSIQLLVQPGGDVRVFGHIPAVGAMWTSISKLRALEQTQIYDEFIRCCTNLRLQCLSSTCQQCQWNNLCGGEYTAESMQPYSVHCAVSGFFYKVFLWQRHKTMASTAVGK